MKTKSSDDRYQLIKRLNDLGYNIVLTHRNSECSLSFDTLIKIIEQTDITDTGSPEETGLTDD